MSIRVLNIILSFVFLLTTAGYGQTWEELNQKSVQAYRTGNFNLALQFVDSALSSPGLRFESVALLQSNKANFLMESGEQQSAIRLLRSLANQFRNHYQVNTVQLAETYHSLAKAYTSISTFDSADYFIQSGRVVLNRLQLDNRVQYDSSTYSIFMTYMRLEGMEAGILHDKGLTLRAIRKLEQLLSDLQQALPDNYVDVPDYKICLNNLSNFYNQLDSLDKALFYAEKYEAVVPDNSLDALYALQNIASLKRKTGDLQRVIQLYHKLFSRIQELGLEQTEIHYSARHNLGETYMEMELYDSAIRQLQFVPVAENLQNMTHLEKSVMLNLADCYHFKLEYKKADSIYNVLIKGLINDVQHNFTYLNEEEKLAYYNEHQYYLDQYKNFALEVANVLPLQEAGTPYESPYALENLFNLQLSTKAVIINSSKKIRSAILTGDNEYLKQNYKRWENLKRQYAQSRYNSLLNSSDLLADIETMERWLTVNSRMFATGFKNKPVDWKMIQGALKPGQAAVEIVRLYDGLVYGALILTPETVDKPAFSIILSRKDKYLEKEFLQHYTNSIKFQIPDTLSYDVFWKPIADTLRAYNNNSMPESIFISNDGLYHQLNLNTLTNGEHYVIDQTEIISITNLKETLVHKKDVSNRKALLVGRPAFGAKYSDLTGTEKEVLEIGAVLNKNDWSVKTALGTSATESLVKHYNSPTVLHLATHGFFNTDGDNTSYSDIMLRSGIILADSNSDEDDGLLTAYEVQSLYLDSTYLVVLSACETGLGGLNHGEGVYGLQRAITVAGSRYLIMSLWKVDDQATQELMTAFYTEWIDSGNIREAFTLAQKTIRQKYKAPLYWGAFVLTGN